MLEVFGMLDRAMSTSMTLDVGVKLAVAWILAGMVGYERQHKGQAAGLRTHILVCLGATMLMDVSNRLALEWAAAHSSIWLDRGRIAAGIIMGVGFLGAGAILHHDREQHGLTTAAMIWFVAALGVAIGAGYFGMAIIATGFALIVVVGLGALERFMPSRGYFLLDLRLNREDVDLESIRRDIAAMGRLRVSLARVQCACAETEVQLTYRIEASNARSFDVLVKLLHKRFASASSLTLERQN